MPDALKVKPYSVTVDGFMPITFYAASPGKARAAAWRQYCHAFPCSFGDFLVKSQVHKGRPGHGYGEAILVEGEPAYRIPIDEGHYVGFCRPGGEEVLRCHPRDVSIPPPTTGRET